MGNKDKARSIGLAVLLLIPAFVIVIPAAYPGNRPIDLNSNAVTMIESAFASLVPILQPADGESADQTITIPAGPDLGVPTVDPVHNRVYLPAGNAFSFPGTLYVIDSGTDTLLSSIVPNTSSGGDGVAVDQVNNLIFFGNQAFSSNNYLIDGSTFAVTNVAVPGCSTVVGVNSVTHTFYSGSQCCPLGHCDGMLTVDGITRTLLSGITDVPSPAGGIRIVVDEGKNLIYASGGGTGGATVTTEVFDGAGLAQPYTLVTSISNFEPSTINQNTHKIYGPLSASSTLVGVVDGSTSPPVVATPIDLGSGNTISGIMDINPNLNTPAGRLYVLLPSLGQVARIDLNTNTEILPRISVGTGAFAVVVNPSNDKVYVEKSLPREVDVFFDPSHQDTTPPDTSITSVVDHKGNLISNGGATHSTAVKFSFTGTDDVSVAGFECSLDGLPFSTCSSPITYDKVHNGDHVFQVRAVDTSGNVDPLPATFSWTRGK